MGSRGCISAGGFRPRNIVTIVRSPSGSALSLYSSLSCFKMAFVLVISASRPASSSLPDRLIIDRGWAGYPPSDGFANISLSSKDPAQLEWTASASRVLVKMDRASTVSSDVSVVVLYKVPVPAMRETANSGVVVLLPSHRPPQNPCLVPSSPKLRMHPRSSAAGDQDREYKPGEG